MAFIGRVNDGSYNIMGRVFITNNRLIAVGIRKWTAGSVTAKNAIMGARDRQPHPSMWAGKQNFVKLQDMMSKDGTDTVNFGFSFPFKGNFELCYVKNKDILTYAVNLEYEEQGRMQFQKLNMSIMVDKVRGQSGRDANNRRKELIDSIISYLYNFRLGA